MSYTIKIGSQTWKENSKDDVIAALIREITNRSEVNVHVIYPDKSGFYDESWGEGGWGV